MDKRRISGLKRSLDNRLLHYSPLLRAIVDKYAIAEVIAFKTSQLPHQINDFCYFCVTKACKSLMAINLLLYRGFPEDTLILLRTVYESYLSMVYVMYNSDKIDDFILKPIAVNRGYFYHPMVKGKRLDYKKVVVSETGEVLPYGVGVGELASGSYYSSDRNVHKFLYPYLSQLSHTNMSSSGNYRDKEEEWIYSYSDKDKTFEATLFAVYLYTLLLEQVWYIEDLEYPEDVLLKKHVTKGIGVLVKGLNNLMEHFANPRAAKAMIERLNEVCFDD